MPSPLSRAALAAMLLLLSAAAFAAPPSTAPSDDYFGVYLRAGKVGTMHVHKDDHATYKGKPAVRTNTDTDITINVLGNTATTHSRTVAYADPKTGTPLFESDHTEAAGRASDVTATFGAASVAYTSDIQGSKSAGTLRLPPGARFLSDPSNGAADFVPKIGMVITGKTFVPETLSLSDEKIEVLRTETIPTSAGVGTATAVEAFVVRDTSDMATLTLYVTGTGDLLRASLPLGMEMRKEPKEVALAVPSAAEIGATGDLAVAVGITPTGAAITEPRAAKTLHLALSGASRDLPRTDNRQSVVYSGAGDTRTADITITASALPLSAGVARFKKPEDAPESLRPFLRPSAYVASGDFAFAELAHTAAGGETDIAKAAARIADFVHRAIAPDPSIAALRTATDINADRRGVCRDYATFYTAIARAAGIPTRECVGVAYVGGAFLYHAWPEVWTGKTGWIALEPTWGMPFADATHLKLAEGEITDLYRVSGDMGAYKIAVIAGKGAK